MWLFEYISSNREFKKLFELKNLPLIFAEKCRRRRRQMYFRENLRGFSADISGKLSLREITPTISKIFGFETGLSLIFTFTAKFNNK